MIFCLLSASAVQHIMPTFLAINMIWSVFRYAKMADSQNGKIMVMLRSDMTRFFFSAFERQLLNIAVMVNL